MTPILIGGGAACAHIPEKSVAMPAATTKTETNPSDKRFVTWSPPRDTYLAAWRASFCSMAA
jgi:hypothetical protein